MQLGLGSGLGLGLGLGLGFELVGQAGPRDACSTRRRTLAVTSRAAWLVAQVAAKQELVNKQREALPLMAKDDWMHRLTLDEGWAQKLKKKLTKHYGTTPSIDHFAVGVPPPWPSLTSLALGRDG